MGGLFMGFFDVLGKAADAVVSYGEKEKARMYREIERYESRLRYKSDSELKEIAKDESRPALERVAASKVYKSRR